MSFLIPPTPWLPFGSPARDTEICLITFHHAGGSTTFFRPWINHPLLKGITVCPVELPGHGQRYHDPCVERLEDILESVTTLVGSIAQRVPRTILFGHSLGSLLAYEVACQLYSRGIELSMLIVSARRPPHLSTPKPWIHEMSDPLLLESLKRLGGVPEEILAHEEFMNWFLPIIRADFSITETYRPPQSPIRLPIPLMALRGEEDQEVTAQEMSQWACVAGGSYREFMYPGGHFYLNSPSILISALADIAHAARLEPKIRGRDSESCAGAA